MITGSMQGPPEKVTSKLKKQGVSWRTKEKGEQCFQVKRILYIIYIFIYA